MSASSVRQMAHFDSLKQNAKQRLLKANVAKSFNLAV